jgi:hypothetical protein
MDMDEKIHEIEMLAAREQLTLEEKLRLIKALRGLTAGGPSMRDELLEDRRLERKRELAEEGW